MRLNVIFIRFTAACLLATGCSSAGDRATTPTPITGEGSAAVPAAPPASNRPPAPDRPPSPPASGTCVATNAQSAIGQRASQQLLEQARVAATASTARFIRPNEPITTEYLGSRLNLQLDLQDVVRAVSCG